MGIALLVFFTPMAFGAVDAWALGIAEGICFSLLILWLVKGLLAPPSRAPNLASAKVSSLAIPAAMLLGLMLFQLVPLPPMIVRVLSLGAYRLYQQSIPGWPNQTAYNDPGSQKHLAELKAASVIVLPTLQEVPAESVIHRFSGDFDNPQVQNGSTSLFPTRWRSLSVAPDVTRVIVLKWLAYMALFIVLVLFPMQGGHRERRFMRIIVLTILAAGIAIAIIGLAQYALWNGKILWFHVPRDWGEFRPGIRATGPFVNADHFANYLAMILPLALAGAVFRAPLHPAVHFDGFQMLCSGASLVIVCAILLSLSRAGWVTTSLAVLVLAWLLQRRSPSPNHQRSLIRLIVIPSVGCCTLLAVALLIVGPNARGEAGVRIGDSISEPDLAYRRSLWTDSVGIIADYPLFGAGLGSWPLVFRHYQRPPGSPTSYAREAHNDYVELAAECGAAGLLLLAWLAWKLGVLVLKDSRQLRYPEFAMFAALISALAAALLHELVDFSLQIPANAILFVILLALTVRIALTNRTESNAGQLGVFGGRAVQAVLAIIALSATAAAATQTDCVYPEVLPFPHSIREAENLILAHPADPRPHLWLADLIFDSTRRWDTQKLAAAIWLDPNNPDGRDRYIQALLSDGNQQEALRQISTSVYLSPSLGNHLYLSAPLIPLLTVQQQAAVEDGLRKAVASGFNGSVDSLGQFYSFEGREFDSARVYEGAARQEHDAALQARYYLLAGEHYANVEEIERARQVLIHAINLTPDDPAPYRDLVVLVYAPQKDLTSADRIIRVAADNGIPPAPLYSSFGGSAEGKGDVQTAEAAFNKVVAYEPSYRNLLQLGLFYLDHAQYELACNILQRAAEMSHDLAEPYFYLAQSEEGAYQYSSAIADYQRAMALAPDNREIKARKLSLLQKIAASGTKTQ